MHRVCGLEIKVVTSILLLFFEVFSSAKARNQIQMAPARLNS